MSSQIDKNALKTNILNRFNLYLPSNEPPKDQRFVEIVLQKLSELNSNELTTLHKDGDLRNSLVSVLSLCELSEKEFKAYIEALKKLPDKLEMKIESQLTTLIFQAIQEYNIPLLKKILTYKADYLIRQQLKKFEESLKLDAKIARELKNRLSKALYDQDISSVEKLVELALELDYPHVLKDPIEKFLVKIAIENGEEDLRVAETLLQKLNLDTSSFVRPLYKACRYGSLECVELFMKYGADIKSDEKALFQAACKSGSLTMVQALIEKAGQAAFNKIKQDLLPAACQSSFREMLEFVLVTGEAISIDYKPLLFAAVEDVNMLKYLLDNGAKETFDSVKQSLLTECLRENQMKAFDFLVENGADPKTLDVTASDDFGNTLLHTVCKAGNLRGVKMLLGLGASLEIKNKKDNSPFDVAIRAREYPILLLLLEQKPRLINTPLLIKYLIDTHPLLQKGKDLFIRKLKEADFQKLVENFAQNCLKLDTENTFLELSLFFDFLKRDPSLLYRYASIFQKFAISNPLLFKKSDVDEDLLGDITKDLILKTQIVLFWNIVNKHGEEAENIVVFSIQNSADPVAVFLPLLKNSVTATTLAPLLIAYGSGILEKCLKEIPLDHLENYKWPVLPYLPAEDIRAMIKEYPDSKKRITLEQSILFDDNGDTYTLKVGLQRMRINWLPYVHSHSYIINRLNQIPFCFFAYAAEDADICPLLIPFLRFMDEPRLYSVIPFVPTNEFLPSLLNMKHNYLTALKAATLEQKRAFLEQDYLIDLLPPLYAKATARLEALQQKSQEERKKELPLLSSQILTCHQHCIQQLDLIEKALIAKSVPENFKEEIEQALALHRTRIASQKQMLEALMATSEKTEEIDSKYLCPFTKEVMRNPVSAHGHTFEKGMIERWLSATGEGKCPICRQSIKKEELKPNEALKKEIEEKGYKPSK